MQPDLLVVVVTMVVFVAFTVAWACAFALGDWITEKRRSRKGGVA